MNIFRQPPQIPIRAPNGRPWNFLVVYGDDWPIHAWSYMPRFNAKYGSRCIDFPNAMSENPLCFPSRAAWMTGQSCRYTGVNSNDDGDTYAAKALSTTVMRYMKNAGYATGWFGKIYNNLGEGGGWGTLPWFHDGVDKMCGQWGAPDYFDWDELQSDGTTLHHGTVDNNSVGPPMTDYSTDVERIRILAWLASLPKDQSWFCNWPTKGVHQGQHGGSEPEPPARYAGVPVTLVEDPLTFGVDPNSLGIPNWASNNATSPWDASAIAAVRLSHTLAARAQFAVDEAVVTVLDYLQATDQLNNTIVMMCTDNAIAMGELRLSGKGTPHKSGCDLLLKVIVPGIAGGQTCYAPVANYDLAPTLCALSGAVPLHPFFGQSMHPLFTNVNAAWREAAYISNITKTPKFRGLKFGTTSGRVYYRVIAGGGDSTATGGWNDPQQSQNVIVAGDAEKLAIIEAANG